MIRYYGWSAGTLAASHAACGAQRGVTTPALRSPLDPCQVPSKCSQRCTPPPRNSLRCGRLVAFELKR